MKIVIGYPPNIEQIREVFNIDGRPVVFAYGDTIFNPLNGNVDDHLVIHEETHQRQQGDDPSGWWKKYLIDKEFRLNQEIEAYQNQYRYLLKTVSKNKADKYLESFAIDLSSNLYGNIVGFYKAINLIKG